MTHISMTNIALPRTVASRAQGRSRWRGLVLPAILVAAWALAASFGWGNPSLLVPPRAVFSAAAEAIGDGSLPLALLSTVIRALAGWFFGAAAGLAIGLAVGLSGLARGAVTPTLNAARQIALFAWVPLFSAWFGTGETMKIVLIGLGAFFPVVLSVEAGCRLVPKPYREVGQLLEFSRRDEILRIILPAAAPTILAGLELAFAIAWIGTIGAEYLIGTGYMNATANGIGVFLAAAREYARMDLVIVGVVALAIVGLAVNRLLVFAVRRSLSWR